MTKRKCRACKYSGMEPDGPAELICNHDDAGPFGQYVTRHGLEDNGRPPVCGKNRPAFEQHPLRNADGSLKGGK